MMVTSKPAMVLVAAQKRLLIQDTFITPMANASQDAMLVICMTTGVNCADGVFASCF